MASKPCTGRSVGGHTRGASGEDAGCYSEGADEGCHCQYNNVIAHIYIYDLYLLYIYIMHIYPQAGGAAQRRVCKRMLCFPWSPGMVNLLAAKL